MATFPFHTNGFLGRPLSLVAEEDGGPLKGNDVIALQTACQMEVRDGVFGRRTHRRLLDLQEVLGVDADGISGPTTERTFCFRRIEQNQQGIPRGLPKGIVLGESGYRLGAQSPVYVRSGVLKADLGAVQFATPQDDEAAVRRALDPSQGIARLCTHLRDKREAYFHARYVRRHHSRARLAGWLACGSWNAPAWTDIWADEGPKSPTLQVQVTLTDGTRGTREEWIRRYVSSKVAFVESWEV